MLRRISFLPKATLETIYYKIVIPSVVYGIAVWGSCSDYLMKDLEQIHLIHKPPRDWEDETVLINANWMPLKYFCSRILNITHRAFYNIHSDDINSLVVKNVCSYSLRKSLNVVVSRPRTEQGRRSFKHRAVIAWNSLHDSIKQLENLISFKRTIKSTYARDISFQKQCSVNYNKNPEFIYFFKLSDPFTIIVYYFWFYDNCIVNFFPLFRLISSRSTSAVQLHTFKPTYQTNV